MAVQRILIFSTNYFPHVGGAEVAIKELVQRLPDIDFDMIVPRTKRALPAFERMGRLGVHRVGVGFSLDKFLIPFFGLYKARLLHKKHGYSAVWSMMASQASIAAAFFKAFNHSIPLVLSLQEGDEEDHLKRYVLNNEFFYRLLIRPWHLLVFKKADLITVISEALKSRALRNAPHAKTLVIPNGVDLPRFQVALTPSERLSLREKHMIPADAECLITSSRLVYKNAVDDIISALAKLPPNFFLIIAGDGPLRKSLEELAKTLKLRKRVLFLGTVSHDELPRLLKASDIFIRPSRSEGMGVSFLEAMAAGIPVIATPVGGIPDFLFDPKNKDGKPPTGLFCAVNDPDSIAEQSLRLMNDRELYAELVHNAQQLVVLRYSWDHIAEQMHAEVFSALPLRQTS